MKSLRLCGTDINGATVIMKSNVEDVTLNITTYTFGVGVNIDLSNRKESFSAEEVRLLTDGLVKVAELVDKFEVVDDEVEEHDEHEEG